MNGIPIATTIIIIPTYQGCSPYSSQSATGLKKQQSQRKKCQRTDAYAEAIVGELRPASGSLLIRLIGKAEKARFHAARQQHQQQCHPRIDISHNAIAPDCADKAMVYTGTNR